MKGEARREEGGGRRAEGGAGGTEEGGARRDMEDGQLGAAGDNSAFQHIDDACEADPQPGCKGMCE